MLVFYDDKQHVDGMQGDSPSAGKPKLVLKSWKENYHVDIMKVIPLTKEKLELAHCPKYVEGILNCTIENGFKNTNKDVADSLLWTTGSFVTAAIHAFENKVCTFSPTSGFHHACYDEAMGFCTFSGLTIAAIVLHKEYSVKRVGIIDFDSHWGNGTVDTIKKTDSASFIQHYSLGGDNVNRQNNKQWLNCFPDFMRAKYSDCEVILYQAGADSHEKDPFLDQGYFTTEQIYERDKMVFEIAKELNIPVVSNLAGGYQNPIEIVLGLHDLLAKAYIDVWGK